MKQKFSLFLDLIKFRLNFLVLVTASIGFYLSPMPFSLERWLHTIFGIALLAFSSSIFNQLMEIREDAKMKRTQNRPLPKQKVSPTNSFLFALFISVFGITHISIKVSPFAAFLGAISLLVYLLFYTPLKKITFLNTFIGAIPGAIPPVIGWVAGGGSWNDPLCIYLFGILFIWQIPHFFAINWLYREDYEKAGYQMWSNQDLDGKRTALGILFFSLLLSLWTLFFFPLSSFIFFLMIFLHCIFLLQAIKFYQKREKEICRKFFLSTLIYLPIVLSILIINEWK